MNSVPASIKKCIAHPKPDFDVFAKQIKANQSSTLVRFGELKTDDEIMEWVTKDIFEKIWTSRPANTNYVHSDQMQKYLLCQIEYWYRMGYDYIRLKCPLFDFTTPFRIRNWQDYALYPWPVLTNEALWMFEFVVNNLPDGMGILAATDGSFLDTAMLAIFGYEQLACLSIDQPDLVNAVFAKIESTILEAYSIILQFPKIKGFFPGDDMGFRTTTLMSPAFLIRHVLPGHKKLAALAHANEKLYFLHCCGYIEPVMDFLINEVQIDAKHSFEDAIQPIESFYSKYGTKIGVLGGLDVDILARADEKTVRARCRKILDTCVPKGRFAFGTGNSITNYCKKDNILAMFDEAFCWPIH
ncbi:MAG: uroporphyrinogen decarboxylase family protein [Sedimentisphaerales bacterium]